ncbi:MAG: methyltransferase domain-containing protein [Rhodospirillaceae bacterium]
MTSRHDHWQTVYSTKSDTAVSWFQERPETSLELVTAGGLPLDARIIDVGGGASRLVDALLDAGYSALTVLDIAPAALDAARARLGARADAVQWVAADITAWSPTTPFDAWHDRAVFHFLTDAADRAAYRAALTAGIRRGGRVIIGTFAPDGPEKCSGLPVMRYTPELLAAELGDNFALLDARQEDHATPSGAIQHFQFSVFARR